MTPSRSPRSLLALSLAGAALAATGCIGPLRRGFAPEQRVYDAEAARSCAVQVAAELGYSQTADREQPPADSARGGGGRSGFTAERRGTTTDGTTVDQLEVSVRPAPGKKEEDPQWALRVVPARYVEDSRQALTPGRSVPRLRPPGPAEGASRLDSEGPRRRRVSATVARRDAAELMARCNR